MDAFLGDLNPKQQEAVLATEGPVLIIAGPGSGKTKTLTYRIAHLLRKGIPGEHILAVTFTNKAAQEMRERVLGLISVLRPPPSTIPFIGTFHSFCVRILRPHAPKIGFTASFTIFDEDDAIGLVKDVMKEAEINPKQFAPGVIRHAISELKSGLVTPDHYAESRDMSDLFPRTIHTAYAAYQKALRGSNAMDFDDLLVNTLDLFKKQPETLEAYQDRFRYIHVDEYQDTDRSQYMITRLLAEKHRNIAVVGDDAQSIYSFRNADIQNILRFERDWPNARVVTLDQNYRSTQIILDAASNIISRNHMQKEKRLWTERAKGGAIELICAQNEREEAECVMERMRDLMALGDYSLKDMVILYRTNAQSRVFEETFLRNNFPYKIIGGIAFYQRQEIKDILAYLRFLANKQDRVSLKRIMNVPRRGIGSKTIDAYLAGSGIRKGSAHALEQFERVIKDFQDHMRTDRLVSFLKYLLAKIRYQAHLEEHHALSAEERWQNVQELVSVARAYDHLPPPQGIEKFLEDASLMSDTDQDGDQKDAVHMMTLHAAKGLEFGAVFLTGCEEGILPHSRTLFDPASLEEERRLCYVGITRAKDRVFLSFAQTRTQFGSVQANMPSRFLGEIPEHLLRVFGEGSPEKVIYF